MSKPLPKKLTNYKIILERPTDLGIKEIQPLSDYHDRLLWAYRENKTNNGRYWRKQYPTTDRLLGYFLFRYWGKREYEWLDEPYQYRNVKEYVVDRHYDEIYTILDDWLNKKRVSGRK